MKSIFTMKDNFFRTLPLVLIITLALQTLVSIAQFHEAVSWVGLTSSAPLPAEINLIYSDIETSRVEITTHGFWKENIRAVPGGYNEIKASVMNSSPLLIKGAPDLEKLTVSLAIPDSARMEVIVTGEEFTDMEDIRIIPSKGNLTRDVNPGDIPYEYGSEYETDAFFPGVITELRTPHIIRDVRGQVMVIYPFRYNPVRKTLRVYTRLVIEMRVAGQDGENKMTEMREDDSRVRAFEGIYERNFINYQEYKSASRYIPLEDDGNMLIISYGPFMADMQDFTDWKNMSGIPTEMVNVSTIGTNSAAIKSYVADYYNANGLTYLLLVGDAAQVPASATGAGVSDNDYGYVVGSDHYPDIFVGRFSAENNAHVQTQVQRTLDYEMEPVTLPGPFPRAMCIASNQGPG
ncbi:MAG: C25 family cysteine peptidase, partial [Bacteroidales bacterium]|nr:C25 family cysteine peptidase [Bacteroidales bacterium]